MIHFPALDWTYGLRMRIIGTNIFFTIGTDKVVPRNNNHLIDAYRCLREQKGDVVLATIIETLGSTYQKAGARMLIDQNGEMTGILAGGCFESDLHDQARSVFATGHSKTLFYDMRASDDVVWGLGLGCNGAVRILLQLVRAKHDFWPLNVFADAVDHDACGVLITVTVSSHPDYPSGRTMFLSASSLVKSNIRPEEEMPSLATARQVWSRRRPVLASHQTDGRQLQAFYDYVLPPSRLLVLGAGTDARPLVQCAARLGWKVSIVDYRPAHIKPGRFPEAESLLLAPEQLNSQLSRVRYDAVVLMTHNFEYDRRYLQQIAASPIPFIGLLGPRQRRDMLLNNLDSAAESLRDRIFGPVGLDIGAQSPEEIALSIMAGIQAALNKRSGGQLGASNANC